MSRTGRILFATLALFLQSRASIIIYAAPKFGAPIVVSNTLVFTSPAIDPPKVFGIDRETGKPLWETPLTNTPIHAWSAPPQVLVSSGSQLYDLNPTNGALRSLLDAKMQIEAVKKIDPGLALLRGKAGLEDHLSVISSADGAEKWRLTNILEVLDYEAGKILVLVGARKDLSTFTHLRNAAIPEYPPREVSIPEYTHLVLLSAATGKNLWHSPLNQRTTSYTGVLVGDYTFFGGVGRIACLSIDDGSVLTNIPAGPPNHGFTLWKQDKRVYASIVERIFLLEYPKLKLRPFYTLKNTNELSSIRSPQFYDNFLIGRGYRIPHIYHAVTGKPLWPTSPMKNENPSDAFFDWEGIHNGVIYYSRAHKDRAVTTINALNLTNLTSKELFSSPIPKTPPRN